MSVTCDACGRPLRDPESVARRHGPTCAARAGLLTKKPRKRKARAQLALDFATPPGLEGVAPAAWPWVLEARARAKALGRVPVPGCPGCELYAGACGLHAPPGPRVETVGERAPAPPRDLSKLPPPGPLPARKRTR